MYGSRTVDFKMQAQYGQLVHEFVVTMELKDPCEETVLVASRQIDPPTYGYEGVSNFTLNPFIVFP